MSSQSLLLLLALVAAALHAATCQDDADASTWRKNPKPDPSFPSWCNKHKLPSKYYPGKFRPSPHCKPQPPPAATCPSGKVAVSYVNLLRSNDSLPGVSRTSGPGVWGMMKVSGKFTLDCFHFFVDVRNAGMTRTALLVSCSRLNSYGPSGVE
jgi:hypothetical protein